MSVKTYVKGVPVKLSKNFVSTEFDCHCGNCKTTLIDTDLVDILQDERDHFGKKLHITSGYRCPAHNGSTKNASKTSLHTQGKAADHYIEGVTPREQAKYLESKNVKGIGLYETNADGHFVHADSRPTKSFWYGQAQAYRSTFGGKTTTTTTKTETTTSSKPTLTHTLYLKTPRMQGADVKWLQERLNQLKYDCGKADGIFGPATKAAVVKFQKANGLSPDGQCGKLTWAKL